MSHGVHLRVKNEPLRAPKLRRWAKEPYISAKEPCIFTERPYRSCLNESWHTPASERWAAPSTGALRIDKRALHTRKRALHTHKRALQVTHEWVMAYAYEWKMSCFKYWSSNNGQNSPIFSQKNPTHRRKCREYPQKSPIYRKRAL